MQDFTKGVNQNNTVSSSENRLSPVVVFAYNRKDKIKKCLENLEDNELCDKSDLYVYSDGFKGDDDKAQVEETQEFLRDYSARSMFSSVKIIFSDKNKGLANSIISGVSEVISRYGRVIVVEDDLLVSNDFLDYMNRALNYYEEDKRYGSISAYSYPLQRLKEYKKDVYALRKGECWGWGTWADRWKMVDWEVSDFDSYYKNHKLRHEFDSLEIGLDAMLCNQMNGKIDSWAVRWCYYLFKKGYLTVYPRVSKTSNVGFDNTGVHCEVDDRYENSLSIEQVPVQFESVFPDKKIERECRFYPARLKSKIKYLVRYYGRSFAV